MPMTLDSSQPSKVTKSQPSSSKARKPRGSSASSTRGARSRKSSTSRISRQDRPVTIQWLTDHSRQVRVGIADQGEPPLGIVAKHHFLRTVANALHLADAATQLQRRKAGQPSEDSEAWKERTKKTLGASCMRFFGTKDRFNLESLEGKQWNETPWRLERKNDQSTVYLPRRLNQGPIVEDVENTNCDSTGPNSELVNGTIARATTYLRQRQHGLAMHWELKHIHNAEGTVALWGNLAEFNPLGVPEEAFETTSAWVEAVPAWKPDFTVKANSVKRGGGSTEGASEATV